MSQLACTYDKACRCVWVVVLSDSLCRQISIDVKEKNMHLDRSSHSDHLQMLAEVQSRRNRNMRQAFDVHCCEVVRRHEIRPGARSRFGEKIVSDESQQVSIFPVERPKWEWYCYLSDCVQNKFLMSVEGLQRKVNLFLW